MEAEKLLRDNQKLMKERDKLEADNRHLMETVDFLTEALLWAGQAEDFQEGGRARKGWESIDKRITEERKKVKELKKEKSYWNIK